MTVDSNEWFNLQRLISSPNVSDASKIWLVQLYALRYEKFQGNAVASLVDLLYKNGLSEWETAGFKDIENVYTQHQPQLGQILEQLLKMRLKEASYPFVENPTTAGRDGPQDIIVFMVGGVTCEEARYISMLNAATPGTRIILGGTTIHNSQRNE
ncbi:vacuolar protein sorting-associated protein 45 [Dissophora globulifera]|uniref:Vacuolar protein sorting-associated protein 45 n=1 Tax=Dissophora globulifera TaxID=979702 RepID=A0A9P6R4H7_9FUNG|nr:vacuolar protein sorting-associated protein 45 [Dissophora globulifera]